MKNVTITKSFKLSNKLDIKFILGPCQIESFSHAFEDVMKFQNFQKNLIFNLYIKVHLIKLIEVVIRVIEV